MNEQIKKLKNQTLDKHFWYTWSKMDYDDVTKFAEKFAELVLQECLVLFENAKVNQEDDVDYGLEEAKNIIKQHFGVEESPGWVCPRCGTDRTKAACPKGHTAALTGDCPMYGVAQ